MPGGQWEIDAEELIPLALSVADLALARARIDTGAIWSEEAEGQLSIQLIPVERERRPTVAPANADWHLHRLLSGEDKVRVQRHEFIQRFPEQFDEELGQRQGLILGQTKKAVEVGRKVAQDLKIDLTAQSETNAVNRGAGEGRQIDSGSIRV